VSHRRPGVKCPPCGLTGRQTVRLCIQRLLLRAHDQEPLKTASDCAEKDEQVRKALYRDLASKAWLLYTTKEVFFTGEGRLNR